MSAIQDLLRSAGRAAAVLAACLAAGCGDTIPRVDRGNPAFAGLDDEHLQSLARGRQEYIARCSGCHALHAPASGDAAYWRRWVTAMAERSRIEVDAENRILDYLLTAGKPQRFDRTP